MQSHHEIGWLGSKNIIASFTSQTAKYILKDELAALKATALYDIGHPGRYNGPFPNIVHLDFKATRIQKHGIQLVTTQMPMSEFIPQLTKHFREQLQITDSHRQKRGLGVWLPKITPILDMLEVAANREPARSVNLLFQESSGRLESKRIFSKPDIDAIDTTSSIFSKSRKANR